jgi:hypothetical protein
LPLLPPHLSFSKKPHPNHACFTRPDTDHVHALDCSPGTYLMSNQQDATSFDQCVNDRFVHNVTIAPSGTGDIISINLGEVNRYIIAEMTPRLRVRISNQKDESTKYCSATSAPSPPFLLQI